VLYAGSSLNARYWAGPYWGAYEPRITFRPPFIVNPPAYTAPADQYIGSQWGSFDRPASFMSMGILVGMGDGSVKVVSGGVSPETWYRAHSPNSGDVLGSDW
jgi:hypothetical protein